MQAPGGSVATPFVRPFLAALFGFRRMLGMLCDDDPGGGHARNSGVGDDMVSARRPGTSLPASGPAPPGALAPATTNAPTPSQILRALRFLRFVFMVEIPLLVAQCAA